MIYLFILLRILDIITTLLNINRWGVDVEGNPVVRYFLNLGIGYFLTWQILMVILFCLISLILGKYAKPSLFIVTVLSVLVVIVNTYCYLFIN